jgi:hypothetical protein
LVVWGAFPHTPQNRNTNAVYQEYSQEAILN